MIGYSLNGGYHVPENAKKFEIRNEKDFGDFISLLYEKDLPDVWRIVFDDCETLNFEFVLINNTFTYVFDEGMFNNRGSAKQLIQGAIEWFREGSSRSRKATEERPWTIVELEEN